MVIDSKEEDSVEIEVVIEEADLVEDKVMVLAEDTEETKTLNSHKNQNNNNHNNNNNNNNKNEQYL